MTKSIYDGAVACWRGDKMSWFKDLVVKNAEKYDIPVFIPYCKLTEEQKRTLWTAQSGGVMDESAIVGIDEFFEWVNQNRYKIQYKYMLDPVQIHAQPVFRPDHLPRLRRQPAPEGGAVRPRRREEHPRAPVDDHRRTARFLRRCATV